MCLVFSFSLSLTPDVYSQVVIRVMVMVPFYIIIVLQCNFLRYFAIFMIVDGWVDVCVCARASVNVSEEIMAVK